MSTKLPPIFSKKAALNTILRLKQDTIETAFAANNKKLQLTDVNRSDRTTIQSLVDRVPPGLTETQAIRHIRSDVSQLSSIGLPAIRKNYTEDERRGLLMQRIFLTDHGKGLECWLHYFGVPASTHRRDT